MRIAISVLMNGLFCIILVLATVSNSLLLLVFHRRPGLRTISNRFVINLLITNLITCWILIPLLLFDNIWREVGGSENLLCHYISLCPIKEGVAVGLCTATVFSVLMIGIDQYFAVLDPLRYHNYINATTCALMILACWITSVLFAIVGAFTISYKSSWYICEKIYPLVFLPEIYQIIFPLVFATLIFCVPFLSICWIYFSIYSAAHENSQRTRRNGSSANCIQEAAANDYTIIDGSGETPEEIVSDKPVKPLHHSSTKTSLKSTSSSIVNSLRHRISNASMFRYREETRAARISALVIVMALFCWFPFALLMIIRSPLVGSKLSHYVKQLGILSLSSNAVMSPLIFAHRNRRIHKELCKIFCISKRRTSYYDNYSTTNQNKIYKEYSSKSVFKTKNTKLESGGLLLNIDIEASPHKTSSVLSCLPKKRSVSILNKVWIINKSEEKLPSDVMDIKIPEVALDVDTSRSSFSSNSSNTTVTSTATHQSATSFNECVDHGS